MRPFQYEMRTGYEGPVSSGDAKLKSCDDDRFPMEKLKLQLSTRDGCVIHEQPGGYVSIDIWVNNSTNKGSCVDDMITIGLAWRS